MRTAAFLVPCKVRQRCGYIALMRQYSREFANRAPIRLFEPSGTQEHLRGCGVKSGELASRLAVSDSLIRKWSGQYSRFLSPRAGNPQSGQDREFNEADQLVMASISHLRDDGKSHDEITQMIDEGWRVEHLPAAPDPQTEELRSKVALVPVDRLHRALDRIQSLEDEMTRLARERDEARQETKQSSERIADLREQLAEARTKAEMLERMLEEEKNRKRGFFGR